MIPIDLTGYRLIITDGIVTVCQPPAPAPPTPRVIPYRSQWDVDANLRKNDCGPACVSMVLDSFGAHLTINEISARMMQSQDRGTNDTQLVDVLREHCINASAIYGQPAQPPCIALVKYAGFLRSSVQDIPYYGWHWLVLLELTSDTAIVHDPDYAYERRGEGDHKHYTRSEWDAAFIPYPGNGTIQIVWRDA